MTEAAAHSPDSPTDPVAPEGFPPGFQYSTYVFEATSDKFDAEKMRDYFRDTFPNSTTKAYENDTYEVTVAPRDETSGLYHVHFSWFRRKDVLELSVGYYLGTMKHLDGEREPFAEEVMAWLGSFFKYESAQAYCYAQFVYSLQSRLSLFPLPMAISSADAEIDGISMRLPSKPNTVAGIRMLQVGQKWYVDTVSEPRVTFATFDPCADAADIAVVVRRVLPEKSS